jgi:lipopolysaccharide transport system ATP-binding protein
MTAVIRAEGLSKSYVIGHRHEAPYATLRDALAGAGRRLASRLAHPFAGPRAPAGIGETREEFWALNDVSFEIRQGERVGIIGRNGAGKSTLLKILSRITEPTRGRVEIRGRVASLLEVGTGFHPELSGRENVYLNGAILGMSKAEIGTKFDEIVDFAEVARFIDTPVKHYSSGMYVRLAFAVAASLEPDILVVDEVLAVGDARFQKKSLARMGEARREGRTIVFVSHNMVAMQKLCSRAVLLQDGRLKQDGSVTDVVQAYLSDVGAEREYGSGEPGRARGSRGPTARVVAWSVEPIGASAYTAVSGHDIAIILDIDCAEALDECAFGVAAWSDEGVLAWSATTQDLPDWAPSLPPGRSLVRLDVRGFALRPGNYRFDFNIDSKGRRIDLWHASPALAVLPRRPTSLAPEWQGLAVFDYSITVSSPDPDDDSSRQ